MKRVATYKFPKKTLNTADLSAIMADVVKSGMEVGPGAKVSILVGFKTVEFKVEEDDNGSV